MSSTNIATPEASSTANAVVPTLDGTTSRVDSFPGAVSSTTATFTKAATTNFVAPTATTPAINTNADGPFIQPSSNSEALGIESGDNRLQRPIKPVTQTDEPSNSGTPLPEGGKLPIKLVQEGLEPTQEDSIGLSRNPDTDAYGAVGLVPDADEIASDVQERSVLSDEDSNSIKLGDEDEAVGHGENQGLSLTAINNNTQNSSGDLNPGKPLNGDEGKSSDANALAKSSSAVVQSAAEEITSAVVNPHVDDATTLAQVQPLGTLLEVGQEDQTSKESSEPAPSYMSPNHEWARILQKRLGKGLNDAQMLARSNSMLASPSILAQSLTQVIPSLQVKDTGAASPGSSGRGYQTAEELFDRPASIEPSMPAFQYDDHYSKDTAFPSSTLANSSQAPLLLFASLNPDQLLGKKSSSQPTAPPPPSSAETISQPQPLPAPMLT
ncbi:hypothetical protein BGX27_002406, partial [Mortierella sp. AM989]